MKHYISSLALVAMVLAGSLLSSCSDDVLIGESNNERYEIGDGSSRAYVSDMAGRRFFTNVEFRDKGNVDLKLVVPSSVKDEVLVSVVYDAKVLEDYNKREGTNYEAFPETNVVIGKNGDNTLRQAVADPQPEKGLSINLSSTGLLAHNKNYVIPLRFKVTKGSATLSEQDQTRLIYVRDLTGLIDCTKYVDGKPGVKVFSCMQINDTNPLNNLSYTLRSSGKPLVDVLILFSANINYNEETGRVYINNNENIRAVLDNREKYLKPLQDRGIKVVLSILGNHDKSGVANLSESTAKLFAQECKAICDAYQLDGIMLDDEYSNYGQPSPGFVSPSSQAVGRLYYEIKKAQPHRMNVVYVYSTTYSLPAIDGVRSGEYIDYALHDYGGSWDLSREFPGLPRERMGLHSQEFAQGRYASEQSLRRQREEGYLSHLIFAMDPYRNTAAGQLSAMQAMARAFYDDELVFDGVKHPKDWQ